jgi:hypothetical protein
MLWRCTKRLAERIPHGHFRNAASAGSQDDRTLPGEWHGHLLLLDQRQCRLLCHDLTRFALFLPGLRAAQCDEEPTYNDLRPHQALGCWTPAVFLVYHAVHHPPSHMS